MEDRQRNGCLANSASAYESDWGKVFRETNNSSNQLVTSKTGPVLGEEPLPHRSCTNVKLDRHCGQGR